MRGAGRVNIALFNEVSKSSLNNRRNHRREYIHDLGRFKILFTSFNTLFSDQHSSRGIKPQTLTLILLDFFRKIEPVLKMQSAISRGESIGILLVLHRIIMFFTDDGKGKSMARHITF